MDHEDEQQKFAVDVGDFVEKLLERQAAVEQRQAALERRQQELETAMIERQIAYEKAECEFLEQTLQALGERLRYPSELFESANQKLQELMAEFKSLQQLRRRQQSGGPMN